MSKMPAKKKSCFQITSVTQAQVAAIGATDDTESIDDPDESRAEDVSAEIYDMSRAEYEPASDRSPSDEALNNVVEVDAPANIPQTSQLSNKVSNQSGQQQAVLSTVLPVTSQQQAGAVSVNTTQTPPSSTPAVSSSAVSCTSRFRVIKLDHGTGEPFRRGRWTCTEFYDKESEGSLGKSGDSIRHANTTLDPPGDRDSGLGHTVGSAADTSASSARIISVETIPTQPIQHTGYSVRQQSLSGTQSAFSNNKQTAVLPQQTSTGGLQPTVPQGVQPVGQNGLPQAGVHLQKSPVIPPSYPAQQQLPLGHHLSGQPSSIGQSQSEYYQPPGQSLLSAGQGSSLPMPGATGVVSVPHQFGDAGPSLPTGPPPAVLLQQQTVGNVPGSLLVSGSTLQTQYIAAGQPQQHSASPPSAQNVPVNAVSSSVPSTTPTAVLSASSAVMPNVTSSAMPQAPFKSTAMQGTPAVGLGQVEGASGQKSDGPLVPGKEPVKPLMTEALQLSTPTVNSLFGIHIPVDGDEDSASGTNVVAIDNKIEQAMDLVKSHLMYAVREEVEVLKEQIKELFERNSVLERENAVLKSLANNEQLSQLSSQTGPSSTPQPAPSQPPLLAPNPQLQTPIDPSQQLQPNVTSA